jgi:hypothetical protein
MAVAARTTRVVSRRWQKACGGGWFSTTTTTTTEENQTGQKSKKKTKKTRLKYVPTALERALVEFENNRMSRPDFFRILIDSEVLVIARQPLYDPLNIIAKFWMRPCSHRFVPLFTSEYAYKLYFQRYDATCHHMIPEYEDLNRVSDWMESVDQVDYEPRPPSQGPRWMKVPARVVLEQLFRNNYACLNPGLRPEFEFPARMLYHDGILKQRVLYTEDVNDPNHYHNVDSDDRRKYMDDESENMHLYDENDLENHEDFRMFDDEEEEESDNENDHVDDEEEDDDDKRLRGELGKDDDPFDITNKNLNDIVKIPVDDMDPNDDGTNSDYDEYYSELEEEDNKKRKTEQDPVKRLQNQFSYLELKALARTYDVKCSGTKEELIERLIKEKVFKKEADKDEHVRYMEDLRAQAMENDEEDIDLPPEYDEKGEPDPFPHSRRFGKEGDCDFDLSTKEGETEEYDAEEDWKNNDFEGLDEDLQRKMASLREDDLNDLSSKGKDADEDNDDDDRFNPTEIDRMSDGEEDENFEVGNEDDDADLDKSQQELIKKYEELLEKETKELKILTKQFAKAKLAIRRER